MKRMLFNATQAEELRVAIVDGQKLIDLDIESAAKEQRKSNIYKAVITRIEPSLEAAFVDYGAERHGFLPFKEISRAYFREGVDAGRTTIKEALREGQELIVQVDKDERGNKGAALTTFISLAGRYLVLMPNNPRGGGVSRRIEGEERNELREVMDRLEVPSGMSLIARTAGIGRSAEELQWDLNYLLQLWRAIEGAASESAAPFLIYQEGSLVIRAIRDYFQPDIGEILIDTDDIFEQAQQFMSHVMPGNVARVKRYRDDVPLFSRFQIEHQIETAFGRQVSLPSGGAIVVDHTEALVSIDVNSGRATRGADIEETALRTNLEAAEEIARQLRLRDLGGLIVIDFIDMENSRAQREVENCLRDALHYDRARVQTGKISRFGLLELSRQRLRPALAEMTYIPCPRCTGTGHIRSTESAALHILRILEEEAMKENTGAVHVQIPVDVATFLLNEKRDDIRTIELRHKANLVLIPNIHLETPAHEIVRLRHDQLNQDDPTQPSYKMVEVPPSETYQPPSAQIESRPSRPEAAVKGITPAQPAPIIDSKPSASPVQPPRHEAGSGLFGRLLNWFRSEQSTEPVQPAAPEAPKSREPARESGNGRGRGRSRNRQEPHERKEGHRSRDSQPPRTEQKTAREDRRKQPSERTDPSERPTQDMRPPRPARSQEPRPPRPAKNVSETAPAAQAAEAAPVTDTPQEEQRRSSRRGRRGRGRDRAERPVDIQAAEPSDTPQDIQSGQMHRDVPLTETFSPSSEQAAISETVIALAPTEAKTDTLWAPVPVADQIIENVTVSIANPMMAEPALAPVPLESAMPETVPAAGNGFDHTEVRITPVVHMQEPAAPEESAPQARPQSDLSATLQESGLIMVETQPGKVSAPAQVDSEVRLGRKPRPVASVSHEPMVQVETSK